MARQRELKVVISGDAKSLNRAFQQAGRHADQTEGRMHKFGRVGVSALAGVGAAAGGVFVVGMKKAVDAYAEAERVGAQTNAVLKSTSGAANVTRKDVEALATAISRKSGIDDEAVQSAENLLLTFTKVRNETGKGKDIFSQATKVIADMSTALGTDMKSSTIQVGKALNDPIKGVTALQRVGVSFTKQQKDQIKAMVESGDQMGAQKMILRELNTEFGGSAKAAGDTFQGSINKAKVEVGNLGEALGKELTPMLKEGTDRFAHFVREMEAGTGAGGRFADRFREGVKDIGGFIHGLRGRYRELRKEGESTSDALVTVATEAFSKITVKMAEGAAEHAPKVAAAFVRGFTGANVWGKLAIGAFLLTKMGGWGAFSGAGRKGGGAFGEGFSKSAASRMKFIGRNVLAADLAVGIAAGLTAESGDRIQAALSASTLGVVPDPKDERARKTANHISFFREELTKLGRAGDAKGMRRLADMFDHLDADLDASSIKAFQREILGTAQAVDRLRGNFSRMRKGSVLTVKELRENIADNFRIIARTMDRRTGQGSDKVAENTKLAIRQVKKFMKDGKLSTAEGMLEIQKLFERTMALYGISGNQAKHDAAARAYHAVTGGSTHATNATHGNATGGWIGMPGERGGDNVPAWLGRGEAVLNRHQQQPVEMALRTVYGMGLDDLFQREQRPHYLATGGRAGGLRPGIAAAVRKVTSKFPLTVTSTTGGTHAPGSFHYRGMAADLGGSPGAMSAASQWIKSSGMARSLAEGIHNPNLSVKGGQLVPSSFWGPGTWAGHANHIHLAIAGALGALTGGGSATIPRVTVKGPASPLRSIIQATLNKSRAGANRYIADQLAAMDPGAEAGSGASAAGGTGSRANMQLGKRMLGNAGQWPALRTLWMNESGWDNHARNPSSGAYGIPQALPASKMGDAANPPKSDPGAQITWGLRYIAGRYGTPAKALAAWRSRSPHWYARGGFAGRAFARGGRSSSVHSMGGPGRPPRRPRSPLHPVRGGRRGAAPNIGAAFEITGADEIGLGAYEAPEPFTALDFAEAAAADAALTDTLVDDIDAAGAILGLAQSEYDAAAASGDPRRRSAAAGTLKQARDNLTALKGQQQDLIDALKANAEATQALADESKRTNDFNARVESIIGTEAVKALGDMMSGYLGQKAGQRIRTPGRGYVASA